MLTPTPCPSCQQALTLRDTRLGQQAWWCVSCERGWLLGSLPASISRKEEPMQEERTEAAGSDESLRFLVVPEGFTLVEALDGVFPAYPTAQEAHHALGPGEAVMPVSVLDEWAALSALMERRAIRQGREN